MATRRKAQRRHEMSEAQLGAVAARFRALSVPSRLRILNALMGGRRTMGELCDATGLEQSNLSRHVSALEQAGCVQRTRKGRAVEAEISDPSIEALCDLVCGSLADRAAATHSALRRR